ncbi:MAG: alpha/beta fold hydrolase [Euryarchaeota archaeon]|nr:alpha/beta fold hydrolase [Euryarchaeota archaeon]
MDRDPLLPALIVVALLAGCVGQDIPIVDKGERVAFVTPDGFGLKGVYHAPPPVGGNSSKTIVLLHPYGTSRADWGNFPATLSEAGFAVLAFDFRGHGESDEKNGTKASFRNFTAEDVAMLPLDVGAAVSFLSVDKHRSFDGFELVGASVGANAAVTYAANDTRIGSIALISPAIDTAVMDLKPPMETYGGALFAAASKGDTNSASAARYAYDHAKSVRDLELLEGSAHGVALFSGSALSERLLAWLAKDKTTVPPE